MQRIREAFLEERRRGVPMDIFGTGYIAATLMQALEARGLAGTVRYFVVSSCREGQRFYGRPVKSLAEYVSEVREEIPLYLAVHESALAEVQSALREARQEDTDTGRGFPGEVQSTREGAPVGQKGIWISPLLPELLYGEPVKESVQLPLREIIPAQDTHQYWLAARFLVMQGILKGSLPEQELYKKSISLFSSPGTAEKRLRHAGALIKAVQAQGFDPARPILLDEEYRLIDGGHRLVLAVLLGEKEIACRLYPRRDIYNQVMTPKTVLAEELLAPPYFTVEEIRMLKEAQACLRKAVMEPDSAAVKQTVG